VTFRTSRFVVGAQISLIILLSRKTYVMSIRALPVERTQVLAMDLPCTGNVMMRRAGPQDTNRIQAYIRALSPISRRNRFLGALNEVSWKELHAMAGTHRNSHPIFIAETVIGNTCTMIGEGRYAVSDGFNCEFAVSVADAWQHKGLGTLLVELIASRAKTLGLRYLVGEVFSSNQPMIALARKSGFAVTEIIADARLVRITKDLMSPKLSMSSNEAAAKSWLIAAKATPPTNHLHL
jgi:GNAT superfamily N-acetyltransferase